MVEYWLRDDVNLARLIDTRYERYDHSSGWFAPSGLLGSEKLGSEIRFTGDWYRSDETEVTALIEKYADENPTTSYVGRLRDPSIRMFGRPDPVEVGPEWHEAPAATPLTGAEPFVGLEGTVADFWRFAMGDLRTNNVRGYLAEYLVAKAVGATQQRVEWDAYDVITPDGITIEVKTSAYLQVWAQNKPSAISFTGLCAKTWTPQDGYSAASSYNADVYVFCVQTAASHDAYDPLELKQWDFYVLPNSVVAATEQKSLGINRVRTLSNGAIKLDDLAAAIATAATISD